MDKGPTETALSPAIREEIAKSKLIGVSAAGEALSAIPFHQYMTLCLYHPEFGYYRGGSSRLGREGDFYTSAYVGDVMGEQLAAYVAKLAGELYPEDELVDVVDWGGGAGRLSRQMLDAWSRDAVPGRKIKLTLADGNPEHRRKAREELAEYLSDGTAEVAAPEDVGGEAWRSAPVVVVANELLDAFPVHRIARKQSKLIEWGVGWDGASGKFVPCEMEPTKDELGKWLQDEGIELLEGQTIEINLDAARWLRELSGRIARGVVIAIDYGDETEELAAPHRMEGTLLCYAKHRAHGDPYVSPGEQDLTAHVNFSHMRREAAKGGWRELWYGTQKRFLVESGLLGKLVDHDVRDPFHPVAKRNRAIRQLLLSDGMSELFKAQIFVK